MKYYLKQKLVSLHHAMKIFDEQDELAYEVESKMLSLHDKTYLKDAQGGEVAYLHAKAFSLHEVHYDGGHHCAGAYPLRTGCGARRFGGCRRCGSGFRQCRTG